MCLQLPQNETNENVAIIELLRDNLAEPEINVKQGSISLLDGAGSHDFGSLTADGDLGAVGSDITFIIENIGSANLTLASVTLTAGDTVDFDLTNSTATPVAAASSTTFTIRFDPLTTGAKSATVTIINNDTDEATYTFTITGTGGKRIFITSATFQGNMGGGLTGSAEADLRCMADGQAAGSTYKAMISDVARTANPLLNWVMTANTTYIRYNDSAIIGTSNASSVFNLPPPVINNLINSFGTGAPVNYWTGMANNWSLSSKHCSNWTNFTGGGPNTGEYGDSSVIDAASINSPGFTDCATALHLVCVEQ